MRVRLLDKYIFKEVFFTFLFGVCAFSAVFIGSGTLYRIARFITEYGAPITSIIKIFVYSLPGIVMYTFPMSMLLAALLTFGRLSASSEITAMRSCGISFQRIASPVLLLGLAVSIFSIAFNEYVVPWANNAYQNVVYYEIEGNTNIQSTDHIILKEIDNGEIQRLMYARRYDAETQTLQNVTLQLFEKGEVTYVENAEYAKWQGSQWTMYQGIIYEIADGNADHTMRFASQTLPVKASPRQIVREQKKPEELTMKEIRQQIGIMRSQFVDTRKMETELYQRVTIPMASLIFALIGVPLGLQPNRSSSSKGFGISLIIIFIYYVLMTMSGAIAQSGALNPAYAVWIPNLVGLIIGGYLMRNAAR
ncbi:LPS export ABC transporter permease LptG [Selenomonas sp. TAMA-11512]|uniref:LptF/LptG family permease n=1 Tax=Selenomonas sp. TAMA-11512 TaxID=3095337 RepID=UPI003085FBEE|nr:LPS export ABC transporter permease LptG [Selenomonas sp. TAMA-11512]